jgi:hypothetical protein
VVLAMASMNRGTRWPDPLSALAKPSQLATDGSAYARGTRGGAANSYDQADDGASPYADGGGARPRLSHDDPAWWCP